MTTRLEAALAELVDALRAELQTTGTMRSDPPRLLTVDEARAALGGIARSTIYAEIAAGRLRTQTVGRRRFCSTAAISDYISQADGDS